MKPPLLPGMRPPMRAFPVDWSRLFFMKRETAYNILMTIEHPYDPDGELSESLEEFLSNIGAKTDFEQLLVLVDAVASKLTDIIVEYGEINVTYEDDVEDMLKAWFEWIRLIMYAQYVDCKGNHFVDEVDP